MDRRLAEAIPSRMRRKRGRAGLAHRYLASQLYGVRFGDPFTWLAVTGGILLAGVLACLLPAWRAMRTNVTDSLRIG